MNNLLYIDPGVVTILPYIVILIIYVCLAFIPSSIAGNKGHSRVGFFFFGLAALIPAIVVACLIKDNTLSVIENKELAKEIRELKDALNKQNQTSEHEDKEDNNN